MESKLGRWIMMFKIFSKILWETTKAKFKEFVDGIMSCILKIMRGEISLKAKAFSV